MKWIGDSGQIITVGNSAYGQGRQYSIFDMRYLSNGPLITKKLEGSSGPCQIHYDSSSSLFFIVNQRDDFVNYFYYHDGSESNVLTANDKGLPQLIQLNTFQSSDQQPFVGMAFLPHRCMDDSEITRSLIMYGKSAEFVSFKLPKRYGAIELPVFENQQIEYQEWESGMMPKDEVYQQYVKQREILEAKFEGTTASVTPKGSRSFMSNQFGSRSS